jgi:hypothetical protein
MAKKRFVFTSAPNQLLTCQIALQLRLQAETQVSQKKDAQREHVGQKNNIK